MPSRYGTAWKRTVFAILALQCVTITGAAESGQLRDFPSLTVPRKLSHARRDLETIFVLYDNDDSDVSVAQLGISTTIQFGSPPQSVQVIVDTGSADTFVSALGENSIDSVAYGYAATNSSTAQLIDSRFYNLSFGGGSAVATCQRYADTLIIPSWPLMNNVTIQGSTTNLTIPAQQFGVCSTSTSGPLIPGTNISGILGLAFPGIAYDGEDASPTSASVLERIAALVANNSRAASTSVVPTNGGMTAVNKTLTRPVFAMRYPTNITAAHATSYGSLTLGGVDVTLYNGNISMIPVVPILAAPSGTTSQIANATAQSLSSSATRGLASSASTSVPLATTQSPQSYPTNTPLQAETFWQVNLEGITLNGQNVSLPTFQAQPQFAILDSGTSAIYGPQAVLTELFALITGATASSSTADSTVTTWSVPCDLRNTISLGFIFQTLDNQNVTFEVTGSDLVNSKVQGVAVPSEDNSALPLCGSFLIGANNSAPTVSIANGSLSSNGSTDQGIWVLGARFLRNVYAVYDFGGGGGGSVGLAALTNDTNIWIDQTPAISSSSLANSALSSASIFQSTTTSVPTTTTSGIGYISPFPQEAQKVYALPQQSSYAICTIQNWARLASLLACSFLYYWV